MTWIVTWEQWYMNRYGDKDVDDQFLKFDSQAAADKFASNLREDKGPFGRYWPPENIEVKKLKYTG